MVESATVTVSAGFAATGGFVLAGAGGVVSLAVVVGVAVVAASFTLDSVPVWLQPAKRPKLSRPAVVSFVSEIIGGVFFVIVYLFAALDVAMSASAV